MFMVRIGGRLWWMLTGVYGENWRTFMVDIDERLW